MSHRDRHTFITGATRGIGSAIAQELALMSTHLTILAKSSHRLAVAEQELLSTNPNLSIDTIAVDASSPHGLQSALRDWKADKDRQLDTVVLNAGSYTEGSLAEIDYDSYAHDLDLNLNANLVVAQELLPTMRSSTFPSRRIVIIGSTAALEPYPLVPSYGIAKWGLRGLAINLREELREEQIGVSFLSPGGTLTDMWEGEELPPNRLLDPRDVALLCRALLSLSDQAVVEELVVRPIQGDIHE